METRDSESTIDDGWVCFDDNVLQSNIFGKINYFIHGFYFGF